MKNQLSPKALIAIGAGLMLASMLVFGLATPLTTIGQETDVNLPGEANSVQVVVGDSTPAANSNVPVNIVATDINGSAVGGASCTFSIVSQPGTDASIDAGPVTTDSNGGAGTTLHTGSTSGTVQIQATCDGASTTVTLQVGGAGGSTNPPASLPDSGNGGYLGGPGSVQNMLVVLLASLGVVLAGAGVMAGRMKQGIRRD